MMKRFFLITALLFAQVALAAESRFVDDAPKGFIHIREESDGVESHEFIRADCIVRLLQISEEDAGKMRHYIRLYTTGTEGSSHDIESATREEAEKVRGQTAGDPVRGHRSRRQGQGNHQSEARQEEGAQEGQGCGGGCGVSDQLTPHDPMRLSSAGVCLVVPQIPVSPR